MHTTALGDGTVRSPRSCPQEAACWITGFLFRGIKSTLWAVAEVGEGNAGLFFLWLWKSLSQKAFFLDIALGRQGKAKWTPCSMAGPVTLYLLWVSLVGEGTSEPLPQLSL